ncbi:hypothetical protein FOA52_013190 [Chlamydomonas sp. UWO 241]|nr:hypothetical protein FOA52_013190 [Chlamydomonas sp. UWO 241]
MEDDEWVAAGEDGDLSGDGGEQLSLGNVVDDDSDAAGSEDEPLTARQRRHAAPHHSMHVHVHGEAEQHPSPAHTQPSASVHGRQVNKAEQVQQARQQQEQQEEQQQEQEHGQGGGGHRQHPAAGAYDHGVGSELPPADAPMPAPGSQRPTLLFDLNGVLINETVYQSGGKRRIEARPQLELLLLLAPHFQIGIFSSATTKTVKRGLSVMESYLKSNKCTDPVLARSTGRSLFKLLEPVLSRSHCVLDDQWESRPDGKAYDTLKPLALNRLDLTRTLLVDNHARKTVPGEEPNVLVMPTWEECSDGGAVTWATLIEQLLAVAQNGLPSDLRSRTQGINARIRQNALPSDLRSRTQGIDARIRQVHAAHLAADESAPAVGSSGHALAAQAALLIAAGSGGMAMRGVQLPVSGTGAGPAHGDEDRDRDSFMGKRMRVGGAADVAEGVRPRLTDLWQGPEDGCEQPGGRTLWPRTEGDKGDARAAPGAPQDSVRACAHDGYGDAIGAEGGDGKLAGHKRGRMLSGSEPLYNGPRHWGSNDPPNDQGGGGRKARRKAKGKVAPHEHPLSDLHNEAAGLALPGSDLDVVILGVVSDLCTPAQGFSRAAKDECVDCLRKLVKQLRKSGATHGIELISKARVPIIKCQLVAKGAQPMPADISIGVANGAAAVSLVRRAVLALPPLRPLCLVLKAILREMGLNEVFSG